MNVWSHIIIDNVYLYIAFLFSTNEFTVNLILQPVLLFQTTFWISFHIYIHSINVWVKGEVTFLKLCFRKEGQLSLGPCKVSQIMGSFPHCLILNKRLLFGEDTSA